ncbi:MAG: hypothetical protein EPN60_05240 [Nevskiaceae bacterium]|nr:MAG: hypothetical protein EPN60_05240 [Nevskiaceae bacterium]
MPKCCVRDDGTVYPYSPLTARNPRFKVLDDYPAEHVEKVEAARAQQDERLEASKRLLEAQNQRAAERTARGAERREQVAKAKADPSAALEAQRQSNEFTGRADGAESGKPPETKKAFVIGTASKEELLAFAKVEFPDAKFHPNIGVEKLRVKIAELAGVKPE